LELLTKTDCRWMREAWGHPPVHTTAHHQYYEVWQRYEDILIKENATQIRPISQAGGDG
jgi:hypothetical protein